MIYLDEPDLEYIPSTRGNGVAEFERKMADFLGVNDCVAVNSGTSALFLSLLACGIGPEDEVVVPATTFVATANAVLMTGAKVVLCDVDKDSWLLDWASNIELVYHPVLEAIVPVSLYGNTFNEDVSFFRVNVIVDNSEALGNPRVNGDYFCYSFNGNKTITTGGGGLIIGANLDKIREIINPGSYDGLGYNLGMPALNARLGIEQLKNADRYIAKKNRFNEIYRSELDGFVTLQESSHNADSSWWMTACLFPEHINIDELRGKLLYDGIPTRRIFRPLNHYAHLKDAKTYPVAEYLYEHGLCLPSSVRNSEDDIYIICEIIKKYI
jgi:perosamine synthetase